MSIEVMKRIKSLLQDGDKIDSHTISAVVAECDAVILTQQPDNASCKSVQKRLEAQQSATDEPVLTTPNFTQLMQILDGLNRCHSRDSKVEFLRSWIRDWTQHKVDKLTHQAPSVPATSEPVAWMASYVDPIGNDHVYVTSHHDLAVENDMHGTPRPLYTHPAPSAPVTPEPVLDATLTRDLQAPTPAPWEASFHKTVTGKPFGIVTGGQPGNGRMDIVICHGPDAYDEPLSFKAFLANAPLIAAAPKLLAALELIANAENSALDLAYCKGVARAAIGASATTSR